MERQVDNEKWEVIQRLEKRFYTYTISARYLVPSLTYLFVYLLTYLTYLCIYLLTYLTYLCIYLLSPLVIFWGNIFRNILYWKKGECYFVNVYGSSQYYNSSGLNDLFEALGYFDF